jgi:hypothetical protein
MVTGDCLFLQNNDAFPLRSLRKPDFYSESRKGYGMTLWAAACVKYKFGWTSGGSGGLCYRALLS